MQLDILVMRLRSDSRVLVESGEVQGRSLLHPQPLSLQELKMF
ncbi:hypothetical protein [Oscillatoria sp. HE19RPO]|nr:hypothetical protein [Oscillatoria sp. HE19RPO]